MTMLSSLLAALLCASSAHAALLPAQQTKAVNVVVKPKVFIVSMFAPEAEIWYGIPEFDILALNVTVPGLSPLFPEVHCTADGDVCQVVTGESEINAATTIGSLVWSPQFDLTESYWMVAGIG